SVIPRAPQGGDRHRDPLGRKVLANGALEDLLVHRSAFQTLVVLDFTVVGHRRLSSFVVLSGGSRSTRQTHMSHDFERTSSHVFHDSEMISELARFPFEQRFLWPKAFSLARCGSWDPRQGRDAAL